MATGWKNGLNQDYSRKLGAWFADRLGAKEQLRKDLLAKPYKNGLPRFLQEKDKCYPDCLVSDQCGYPECKENK